MIEEGLWRGRRVFLTGHTGFKGAWLSAMLLGLGAEVTGYALDPPTEPALFELAGLGARMTDRRGDLRDGEALARAVERAAPEIILHMGAQSLVKAGYADPLATYATNVMGTLHLLEAARACADLRAIIVVTTDKCYENTGDAAAFREGDPLGGFDPYASSKACAELVAACWRDSFLARANIAVATARAGNVIGGGDYAADRILPDAMRAFARGEPLQVRAPQAVRPWQHVLDPLGGYLLLAERAFHDPAGFSGAWNFGPGRAHEQSVERLLQHVTRAYGGQAQWQHDGRAHPHEAAVLRLDASKARRLLGWSCRLDFEESIAWSVDFYRQVGEGADASVLMQAQIAAFLAASRAETV